MGVDEEDFVEEYFRIVIFLLCVVFFSFFISCLWFGFLFGVCMIVSWLFYLFVLYLKIFVLGNCNN